MADRKGRPPARGFRTGAVVALFAIASPAAAQEDCEFHPPTEEVTSQTVGATTIFRARTPHIRCADGVSLRADSARHFENQAFYQLFGDAFFEDLDRRIEGELIRYWRRDGRVEVRGNGRIVRKDDGSVVTGDEMNLLQAGARRDQDQLTVTGGRPRAVFPPDAPEGPSDETEPAPWDVVADRLFFYGEESLTASGDVEVVRDSLEAYARTLEFDQRNDRLSLRRDARMITGTWELTGDSILGSLEEGEIRSLRAMDDGVLVGEDIRLAAPSITLEMPGGTLERLVAVRGRDAPTGPPGLEEEVTGPEAADTVPIFEREHPPRPVARAEDFLMVADSIEVQAPGEVLNRLIAVGRARGESTGRDSLNTATTPEIARRDWIDGDTIVASFSQVESASEGAVAAEDDRNYRLDELLARVNARSLYRMAPADTAEARDPDTGDRRLAVHYVTGSQIRITFAEGEVDLMEVAGPTEGIHLEPFGGSDLRIDTAAVDTAAVAGPDTTAPSASGPARAGVDPGPSQTRPAVSGGAAPALPHPSLRIPRTGRRDSPAGPLPGGSS